MNSNDTEHIHRKFKFILGERFTTNSTIREFHAKDASYHVGEPPFAVAFPKKNKEVSDIVKVCLEYKIPIIPYGTGTGVEGGTTSTDDILCISLMEMNDILRVGQDDKDATVQAGVTRLYLNEYLTEIGSQLYFPVDPGADASLGGMAATRASGTSSVSYGTMADNILGLTIITPDGTIVKTGGRAPKSSAGYDLTRLFIGSEGTLGIITEITVKLVTQPESVAAAVCSFTTIEDAVNTVIKVNSVGIHLARIELLDENQMKAVNEYSGLDYDIAPTLFLEFHGSIHSVEEDSKSVREIVVSQGGKDFRWATDEKERDQLWQARYDCFYACLNLRRGAVGYVTDVCVPISNLASCISKTKDLLSRSKLLYTILGHVGDGNFHVVFPLEMGNKDELVEARSLSSQIVEIALMMEGTCTGEHGIGLGKREALYKEHEQGISLMRTIKQAIDPYNLMNPGKVIT
ncbi:FAD-binding oxidoreductase [Candidatus Poribacteria bacterium]|nr:MAG: FAD-binding oxidoreductase [Candidatus Poribacteria bacterium]